MHATRFGTTIVLGLALASAALADESKPADLLKGRGLERSGSLYLLAAEADAQARLKDALSLQTQWNLIQARLAAIQQDAALIQQLDLQGTHLQHDINALNVQLDGMPARGNSAIRMNHQAVVAQRNELRSQMNEVRRQLTLLRRQAPTPKDVKEVADEVKSRRGAYLKALGEARKVVDQANKTYGELAGDEAVAEALVAAGKASRPRPKLGPSDDFRDLVRQLARLEKSAATGSKAATRGLSSRKPNAPAKGKR